MALKVMTVVGTRPEVIKLSRIIHEFDRHTQHILVHTGQNYDFELNEIFFQQLGLRRPDHVLDVASDRAARCIANVIAAVDEVIEAEKPDAFLILGDTNSGLSAIAAKRRQIPIFHLEAGNRCFDERVPEEVNRRIIDHISDINLPYTEHARRYLVAEGIRPETVIKTGSPMREVLAHYAARIESSSVLEEMQVVPGAYIVVSAHREENIDNEVNFANLLQCLQRMATQFDMKVIVSTHPRTRKRLEEHGTGNLDHRLTFVPPMGFLDYVKLQQRAYCVVSDSGTLTEECSIVGFPAVMIRESHERPEGMDAGALVMAGLSPDRVVEAIELVTSQIRESGGTVWTVPDYEPARVSTKVVRIVLGYTNYVARTVWRK
jgi:UDP-N-acetylglucosamine 2-epimerase (non-hydrolysing)